MPSLGLLSEPEAKISQMEGDDAVGEMRYDKLLQLRIAIERHYRKRVDGDAAGPGHFERARRQNFPAVTVGDVERQTAIRVVVLDLVHPCTRRRSGADRRRIGPQGVADELHGRDRSLSACVFKRRARSLP